MTDSIPGIDTASVTHTGPAADLAGEYGYHLNVPLFPVWEWRGDLRTCRTWRGLEFLCPPRVAPLRAPPPQHPWWLAEAGDGENRQKW